MFGVLIVWSGRERWPLLYFDSFKICGFGTPHDIFLGGAYVFSDDLMSFLAILTRDPDVERAVGVGLKEPSHRIRLGLWSRLGTLVKERPVTGVVLDSALLPEVPDPVDAIQDLTHRFPSLWLVLVTRRGTDPLTLVDLGRAGIGSLVATHLDQLEDGVESGLREGLRRGTAAMVTHSVSRYLPASECRAVHLAMVGAPMGWDTKEYAERVGYSRTHLSHRLRGWGLPSAGHLLVWARLLHAGRWLGDPGRTGQSVARQLDYSSGAAFRRVLRNYVGSTPMQVREGGGLPVVLSRFLAACGLKVDLGIDRDVA